MTQHCVRSSSGSTRPSSHSKPWHREWVTKKWNVFFSPLEENSGNHSQLTAWFSIGCMAIILASLFRELIEQRKPWDYMQTERMHVQTCRSPRYMPLTGLFLNHGATLFPSLINTHCDQPQPGIKWHRVVSFMVLLPPKSHNPTTKGANDFLLLK